MEDIKDRKVNQGRNVRDARNWKGFTQTELGEKIGMDQPHISDVENSETVKKDILLKVAKALDVSMDFLETFVPHEHMKCYTLIQPQQTNEQGSNNSGSNIGEVEKYEDNSLPFSAVQEYINELRRQDKEIADMRVLLAKHGIDYNPDEN